MTSRPVMLAGLLGTAVGVPYVVDNADTWTQGQQSVENASVQSVSISGTTPDLVPNIAMPASPGDQLYTSPAPLEGLPSYSLSEVLRLDVNKEWVYQRWARKSTGLAEVDLFGIRVPYVSGTRMTDVAGSLTYYFDRCGRAVKLRLTGKTANTSQLVNLCMQRYGLKPQTPTVAGQLLYQKVANGRVESELRTWPGSVMWSTSPHDSYSFSLEINLPGSLRYVKQETLKLSNVSPNSSQQPNLLGNQPPPAAEPMFPAESVVPSSDTAPQAAGESKSTEPIEIPKKQRKSPLRWPS